MLFNTWRHKVSKDFSSFSLDCPGKKEGRRNEMGMMRREGAEFFRIFFVFPPPGSGGEMEGREALPTGSQ